MFYHMALFLVSAPVYQLRQKKAKHGGHGAPHLSSGNGSAVFVWAYVRALG